MLVIRRRPGESIWIGDAVEVEVIDAGPGRVKLGIRAPREIPVVRNEIRTVREQNVRAAGGIAANTLQQILTRVRQP
jgi:carbon storage regulator